MPLGPICVIILIFFYTYLCIYNATQRSKNPRTPRRNKRKSWYMIEVEKELTRRRNENK